MYIWLGLIIRLSNLVLLDEFGHVHLTDFNIAVQYKEEKNLHAVAGSMAYMGIRLTHFFDSPIIISARNIVKEGISVFNRLVEYRSSDVWNAFWKGSFLFFFFLSFQFKHV